MAVTVPGGGWLADDAGAAYVRALAAGCPSGVTSAGRSTSAQRALFVARYRHAVGSERGPYGDRRGPYEGRMWVRHTGAAVGVPGTSRHETGRALDLPAFPRAWMTAHGGPFGWVAGRVPGEPWHFEYDSTRDTMRGHMTDGFNADDRGGLTFIYQRVNPAPAAGLIASQGDVNVILARLDALTAKVDALTSQGGK